MSNYSPSFDDNLDKVHGDESSTHERMQELPPQEYKDSQEHPDEENLEKLLKKRIKLKQLLKSTGG